MKLILMLILIATFSTQTFAQSIDTKKQESKKEIIDNAKTPEKDGTTDRAPIDEGGGPRGGEDKKPSQLQQLINEATQESPLSIKKDQLEGVLLLDGKKVLQKDIKDISLTEDQKLETIELKNNQILHRLDVETATVKPSPLLPTTVSIQPNKLRFYIQDAKPEDVRNRLFKRSELENAEVLRRLMENTLPTPTGAIRVLGVDGGGRVWINDSEDNADSPLSRIRTIGVDGGG